jgi:hypothetical protein
MELKRCGVGGGRKSIPPELEDETNLRGTGEERKEMEGRLPRPSRLASGGEMSHAWQPPSYCISQLALEKKIRLSLQF